MAGDNEEMLKSFLTCLNLSSDASTINQLYFEVHFLSAMNIYYMHVLEIFKYVKCCKESEVSFHTADSLRDCGVP
jgi:hypothetical protein